MSENIEIISSKLQDMEGAGKGSECGRSKSDKLGQEGPLRSDRVIKHPVWSGMVK